MQHLEVSGAVRHIYMSLGFKRLSRMTYFELLIQATCNSGLHEYNRYFLSSSVFFREVEISVGEERTNG